MIVGVLITLMLILLLYIIPAFFTLIYFLVLIPRYERLTLKLLMEGLSTALMPIMNLFFFADVICHDIPKKDDSQEWEKRGMQSVTFVDGGYLDRYYPQELKMFRMLYRFSNWISSRN